MPIQSGSCLIKPLVQIVYIDGCLKMSTTRNLVVAVGYGPGWLTAQAKPIKFFLQLCESTRIHFNYRNICLKLPKVQQRLRKQPLRLSFHCRQIFLATIICLSVPNIQMIAVLHPQCFGNGCLSSSAQSFLQATFYFF